jgi:cell division protein ZapB
MADNNTTTFEHELRRLEKRVDALVRVCDQLQDENKSLKQRQDILTAERANLLRVEAMIGRLKAMEQGT